MINVTQPVITDFAVASAPVSDYAKKLAAEANAITSRKDRVGGIKGLQSGRSDTFRLNPYLIVVKQGLNCREINSAENQAHIDTLARSIAVNGVIEPLTVYIEDGIPILTNGECRLLGTFRAIEVYGAEVLSVPVKTEVKGAGEAERLLTQVVSNSGKPFNAFETGSVYRRFLGLGWSIPKIAEKCATSVSRVNQILELAEAPEEIKNLVLDGKVSATLAWETMKAAPTTAEAVETLTGAVENAEANGKTKATKRFIGEDGAVKKAPFKKTMKEAFDAARIEDGEDGEDGVTVTFSAEDFAKVRDLLKL